MKPEIATTNIIYKSKSPIGTNKTERFKKKEERYERSQSPIGTNKTQMNSSSRFMENKVSIPYRYKQNYER